MAETKGKIRIEGDATSFNKTVADVNKGLESIENVSYESFMTTANNALGFFEKIKGYITGMYDHIKNAATAAADVERGDVAWKMLQRYNKAYYDVGLNIKDFTLGLIHSRDAVFLLNKAINRNIGLTKDQLQDVFKMSTQLAISSNLQVSDVFNKLSESMGKLETAPLEELGIIIKLDEVVAQYAKTNGLLASEIDKVTKKELILKEVRKKIKEGLAGTVDFKEVDLLTKMTQAVQEIDDKTIDLQERYNKMWAKRGLDIVNFYKNEEVVNKLERAKRREILKELGGQYSTWADYQSSQQQIVERNGKAIVIYSNEYVRNMERIKSAVIDARDAFKSRDAFDQFYIALQDAKWAVKPLTDQLQQLKNSIWFLKSEPVEIKPVVDKGKIDSLRQSEISQIMGYYDKINEQEFKTYQDKEAWEKQKADLQKRVNKMGLSELKLFKKEYDKILFGKETTEKETQAFEKQLEDARTEDQKKLEQHKAYIESKMLLDEELTAHSLGQLQARKKTNLSEAQNLNQLVGLYNKEIEYFKQYASLKQLSQENLSGGLESITNRYISKKNEMELASFDFERQLQEQAKSFAINTANSMYAALFSEEENALQRAVANSMMQAGSSIFAAGVENLWVGFGKLFNPLTTAIGTSMMGAGSLQVAASLALGYTGKALMPSGSSKSEQSAKIENQQAKQDRRLQDESKIFLFPSEQKWLEEVNRANKKINK